MIICYINNPKQQLKEYQSMKFSDKGTDDQRSKWMIIMIWAKKYSSQTPSIRENLCQKRKRECQMNFDN